MNFALGSILVVLILLPGFVLRKGYYSYPFSKKFIPENIFTDLVFSIAPAFIIHGIYLCCVNKWSDHTVNLTIIGNLLASSNDPKIIESCYNNITEHANCILRYNIGLLILAYVTGNLLRVPVRFFSLDKRHKIFRFDNEWH